MEIWKMLAGLSIFLLGMNFLEEGLKHLSGRSFKLFLKKQTANKLKAVGGGAVVTAVLQSSSVVNLMVLAFAGAGIIGMTNAIAVMLGANVGTTLSNWVIATVGFKFGIENFALPAIAIAGAFMTLSDQEKKIHHWSKFILGIAFLFFGLGFIKTGMEDVVNEFDLSAFEQQPAIVFLLAGFIITSLIQSSSATVAIVLSALNADAISLFSGMAIVLGAEIGTSIKLILASLKGLAIKKRIALGNLILNIATAAVVFIFLRPLHELISNIVKGDELIALVLFQTVSNLMGVVLFYPFLNPFGRFLDNRFKKNEGDTLFIHKVKPSETDIAITAVEKEARHLVKSMIIFTKEAFGIKTGKKDSTDDFISKNILEKYDYIKHLHGEIHEYSLQVRTSVKSREGTVRLQQLTDSTRNIMYAAKNIKDAMPDIDQLSKSSNDRKYEYFKSASKRITEFSDKIEKAMNSNEDEAFIQLKELYKETQEAYSQVLDELYREESRKLLNEVEFSTVMNFNREIFTFEKSIFFAMKDLLLSEEKANEFDNLPGFIR